MGAELEQEFETEINKHNNDQKQAGQIIQAISNIYSICEKLAPEKGRKLNTMNDIYQDGHPQLVNDLLTKLKVGTEYIGDLIHVSKMLKELSDERLEDRDKYYGELAKKNADEALGKNKDRGEQMTLEGGRGGRRDRDEKAS